MKNFKKIGILLMVLFLVLSTAACGNKSETNTDDSTKNVEEKSETSTDDSLKKVQEKKELSIGFCAQYPPFESRNEENGEYEGFDVDIAKAIGKEIGVDVVFKDVEWTPLFGGLSKGDYDVIISAVHDAYLENYDFNHSNSYFDFKSVVVVKKDDTEINSLEDLKGKTIGVQMGSGTEAAVEKLEGLKEIKRYDYTPTAFSDLEAGRIDAVGEGLPYSMEILKEHKNLRILKDDPVVVRKLVVLLQENADELTNKVNEALDTIKENGTYDSLVEKWFPEQ